MPAKILITGLANTGKTSLLRTLKDVLVIARDGKPFSLPLPHVNIQEFSTMGDFLNTVSDKIEIYNKNTGDYPRTIAFDSVSRIFTDIEIECNRRFKGFDVWKNVNSEITMFTDAINDLQSQGFNIVLIAHSVWDSDAKKYIETCKGSFAKTGGFLSTVDYAINIDILGSKRIITHRGNNLSRTLIQDMPDKEDASTFNLQDYIEKIEKQDSEVEEFSL